MNNYLLIYACMLLQSKECFLLMKYNSMLYRKQEYIEVVKYLIYELGKLDMRNLRWQVNYTTFDVAVVYKGQIYLDPS